MTRKVAIGIKHIPEMIGRTVWYGRKTGVVRSLDHTKLYVQFGLLPPMGIGAHKLYLACYNWGNQNIKCRGHVEPLYQDVFCEKCTDVNRAARQREEFEY